MLTARDRLLQKLMRYAPDLLLSAAPVESHVGAIVVRGLRMAVRRRIECMGTFISQDSPNACVTLALPLGIFDFVSNRTLCLIVPTTTFSDRAWYRISCRRRRVLSV